MFCGSQRQENNAGTKEACWQAHGGRRTTRGQRRLAGRLTAAGEQRGDKGGLLAGSRRQENSRWLEFPTDNARMLNAKRQRKNARV